MRSSRSRNARNLRSGEWTAFSRCSHKNWSSSKCSSRMSRITVALTLPSIAALNFEERSILCQQVAVNLPYVVLVLLQISQLVARYRTEQKEPDQEQTSIRILEELVCNSIRIDRIERKVRISKSAGGAQGLRDGE